MKNLMLIILFSSISACSGSGKKEDGSINHALKFNSVAFDVSEIHCTTLTLYTYAEDEPIALDVSTVANLAATNGGKFYTDSSCTSLAETAKIPQDSDFISVFFASKVSGSSVLTATHSSNEEWTKATATATVALEIEGTLKNTCKYDNTDGLLETLVFEPTGTMSWTLSRYEDDPTCTTGTVVQQYVLGGTYAVGYLNEDVTGARDIDYVWDSLLVTATGVTAVNYFNTNTLWGGSFESGVAKEVIDITDESGLGFTVATGDSVTDIYAVESEAFSNAQAHPAGTEESELETRPVAFGDPGTIFIYQKQDDAPAE